MAEAWKKLAANEAEEILSKVWPSECVGKLRELQQDGSVTLPTGALLCRMEPKHIPERLGEKEPIYFISGYACDGSDAAPYI